MSMPGAEQLTSEKCLNERMKRALPLRDRDGGSMGSQKLPACHRGTHWTVGGLGGQTDVGRESAQVTGSSSKRCLKSGLCSPGNTRQARGASRHQAK